MGWRERLVDVARFMVRPSHILQPASWRPGFGAVWGLLVMLTLLAVLLARVLIEAVLGSIGVVPDSTVDDSLGPRAVLSAVVLAPLLEEALSRGWLSGRVAALRFAAYGVIALALLLAGLIVSPDFRRILALAAAAVVFAGLIHWSLTRHRDSAVPGWFIRHFRWLVWGSSLVFALLHLGNYEALTHPLGVLVVMPLMIGGMLLAYTRTRLGLRAAMLHHAAYNAVLVGLALTLS
ncbi:MAG: CPBP family intramembrane metalloprotease [Porphyrobacter sp. IPPAS B-1204]|nr:MAG: CPBP family intramembrane metalloprotease [Porphyrobacter sp. IPPAS B-1204]